MSSFAGCRFCCCCGDGEVEDALEDVVEEEDDHSAEEAEEELCEADADEGEYCTATSVIVTLSNVAAQ